MVVGGIPLPGIGGHDGAVYDGIGVHDILPHNGGKLREIAVEPYLERPSVRSGLAQFLHITAPQLQEVPEGGHVQLLLRGVAFDQGHPQVLGVLEELVSDQDHAKNEHAHTRRHQQDAQRRMDECSLAAVHCALPFSIFLAFIIIPPNIWEVNGAVSFSYLCGYGAGGGGRGWNEEICLRATLVKISGGFEITPAYMRGLADRQPEKQKSSAPV